MASHKNHAASPDLDECRLERILDHLYRCLANRAKCRYALQADATRTYCRYPDKSGFKHVDSLEDAVPLPVRRFEFDCAGEP